MLGAGLTRVVSCSCRFKNVKGKSIECLLICLSITLRNRYQSSPCDNCNYLQSLFGCTFIGEQMQIAKPRSKPHYSSARGRMCNCKVRLFRNRLLHAKPSSRQRDPNEGQWFHSLRYFLHKRWSTIRETFSSLPGSWACSTFRMKNLFAIRRLCRFQRFSSSPPHKKNIPHSEHGNTFPLAWASRKIVSDINDVGNVTQCN